jgi:hypothetical protein
MYPGSNPWKFRVQKTQSKVMCRIAAKSYHFLGKGESHSVQ